MQHLKIVDLQIITFGIYILPWNSERTIINFVSRSRLALCQQLWKKIPSSQSISVWDLRECIFVLQHNNLTYKSSLRHSPCQSLTHCCTFFSCCLPLGEVLPLVETAHTCAVLCLLPNFWLVARFLTQSGLNFSFHLLQNSKREFASLKWHFLTPF